MLSILPGAKHRGMNNKKNIVLTLWNLYTIGQVIKSLLRVRKEKFGELKEHITDGSTLF